MLLERQEVNLPSPKNYYNKDICVKHRKEQISYTGRYQTTNDLEMMSMNWKYFEFKKQIPVAKQKDIQLVEKLILHDKTLQNRLYLVKLCKPTRNQ